MVCELTGMEISNASMYDGASAAAEAAVLAALRDKETHRPLRPERASADAADGTHLLLEQKARVRPRSPAENGRIDRAALMKALEGGDVAALIVQSPNFLRRPGEPAGTRGRRPRGEGALHRLLRPACAGGPSKRPESSGADIVVGDGQTAGNPMNFGGPAFGFIAVNKPLMRKMPGRICGQTTDSQGRRTFVLTLQAREQHIRREKATSNICSNQNLCIVAASVYLSLMGPRGLRDIGGQILAKSAYAVEQLEKTGKFRRAFPGVPSFRETALLCDEAPAELNKRLLGAGHRRRLRPVGRLSGAEERLAPRGDGEPDKRRDRPPRRGCGR